MNRTFTDLNGQTCRVETIPGKEGWLSMGTTALDIMRRREGQLGYTPINLPLPGDQPGTGYAVTSTMTLSPAMVAILSNTLRHFAAARVFSDDNVRQLHEKADGKVMARRGHVPGRGFLRTDFTDAAGHSASIQESSVAAKDGQACLWLGLNSPVIARDDGSVVSFPLPHDGPGVTYVTGSRMHLDQDMAASLADWMDQMVKMSAAPQEDDVEPDGP